jgi:hypothetical protein
LKVPPKFDSLFAHEFVVQFDGDEWSGAAGFASRCLHILHDSGAFLYGDALRIKNQFHFCDSAYLQINSGVRPFNTHRGALDELRLRRSFTVVRVSLSDFLQQPAHALCKRRSFFPDRRFVLLSFPTALLQKACLDSQDKILNI